MADTKYLKKIGNTWVFQKKVNKDLAKALGQSSLVYNKSLKTDSLKEAQALRYQELALLDNLLERERIKEKFGDVLKQIDYLSHEDIDHKLNILDDELKNEYPHLGSTVWEAMSEDEKRASGLPLSETLMENLEYGILKDKQSGKRNYQPPISTRLTLEDCLERILIEKRSLKDKSRKSYTSAANSFAGFLGKKPSKIYMFQIKRAVVRDYVLSQRDVVGKASSTISKNLSHLGTLWKLARDLEELESVNPYEEQGHVARGTANVEKGENKKTRMNWKHNELIRIVNGISGNKQETDKLFIYIAWFTGARLGEIYRITPEDILFDEEYEVQHIAIHEGKSESAVRKVPIHKDLYPLLRDFKGWERSGTPDVYSKMFTRAKEKAGYIGTKYGKKVFHSIRGNTITELEIAGVAESTVAQIVGHKDRGQTMSFGYYSSGKVLSQLKESVDKIPNIFSDRN